MKLGKFLNDTADQILSTLLLAFSIYCLFQGIRALVESPPDPIFIYAILMFGFILGILKYFTDEKNTQNTGEKNDLED